MAGFTAPPDNSAQIAGEVIAADGWFPGINTADIAKKVRIGDGAVTQDRLREATVAGILSGLKEMSVWRSKHAAAGIASLGAVTQDEVAGENVAELHWRRIVMFYAAAEIVDGHTDVAATDEALDREDEKRDTADKYRRRAYEAVSDLLAIGATDEAAQNRGRNRVELL